MLLFLFIEIKRNDNLNWIILVSIICLVILMIGMSTMHKKGRVYGSFNFILFGLMLIVYNIVKYITEKQFNVIFLGEFVMSVLAIYGGFKLRK